LGLAADARERDEDRVKKGKEEERGHDTSSI
jgi:hypothetical protein